MATALFGFVLMMAGVAYYIIAQCLVCLHGADSILGKAVGNHINGKVSVVVYAVSIILSWFNGQASLGLYELVAII